MGRRHIVVKEQDVEAIRRQVKGRWQWARPTICKRQRIVLERSSGKILEAPHLGKLGALSRKP
jgi:hypothetical protein